MSEKNIEVVNDECIDDTFELNEFFQIFSNTYGSLSNKIEESLSLIKSDYNYVKDFTEEAYQIKCPDIPQKMTKETVTFLIKMMLSEIVELAETVTVSPSEALLLVKESLGTDAHIEKPKMESDEEIIASQADALVDSWYYSLNVASKHGIDLSKVFNVVHKANMNKRDPTTGKFILRESDGKILKPVGWTSPDLVSVLFPSSD